MDRRVIVALAVAVLLWGTSYALVKTISAEVPPITIALLRTVISLPLLIPLAFYKGNGAAALRSNWKALLALGISGVAAYQVLQNIGITMTSTSEAGVLLNSDPIFIAILSAAFLKEKIGRYKAIGIAVAFVGVSVIVLRSGVSVGAGAISIAGDIFAILAALSWAIYSVHGKRVLEKGNTYDVTAFASLMGAIVLAPLTLGVEGVALPSDLTTWLILVFLGLGASGTAYLMWYVAVKGSNASDAGVALFFVPLIAVTVGILFMGEELSLLFGVGTALVLIGVTIAERL
jgi:drug/metabolite transporter (DMT)-like permease